MTYLLYFLFSLFQLLQYLKQVRLSIRNTTLYFDAYGNPPTGYDIVTWIWINKIWSLRMVGSFISESSDLQIDASQLQWVGHVSNISYKCDICLEFWF